MRLSAIQVNSLYPKSANPQEMLRFIYDEVMFSSNRYFIVSFGLPPHSGGDVTVRADPHLDGNNHKYECGVLIRPRV